MAFLDVLGFRDLIHQSVGQNAPVTVDQICSILDIPPPIGEDKMILGRIGDISRSGHRLTAFSDSIVLTTDPTEQGLMHLLHHAAKIGFNLARLNALYRGGVVRGLVYHDDQQVFGPAVVTAHDIEKHGKWPRVVLSEEVIRAGRSAEEPVRTVFSRLTRVDDDGKVFVHYLRVLRMVADMSGPLPADMRTIHEGITSFIMNELYRLKDRPNDREKVEWFRSYFHWAINAPTP
ncbi:MAG: hypothetical protein EPO61_08015 [Nitrospirae bacterium]|nr:MAG: hypothetical protein EPO61_08015 [Nitrospirota bacterium]